ncbi:MAG TPA: FAD-dependent oxidoreductase [Vicinamibacterales bacterium]|nr:FAD-dependent oxidoreductase [Vicinamibacterales bacterium]
MSEDRDLGLGAKITRKDFLNASLLGVGGLLIGAPSPAEWLADRAGALARQQPEIDAWTGYGGVGDYAASNGNTRPVLEAAHRVRDGRYSPLPSNTVDTGELYDVVVIGGGISGLTAAYRVAKATNRAKTCLVIENHPMFGGGAKRNEFSVNGVKLVGPQASNQFGVPREGTTSLANEIWTDFGLPRAFAYQDLAPEAGDLKIPLDNYAHMDGVNETQVDVGYFFDDRTGAARPTWLRNIWRNDLADTPFPPEVKQDLLRWRSTSGDATDEFRRKLDTMTYAEYLERELKLRPEVTKFVAPIVGLINGAGPDGVSAFAAAQIGMPGVARVRSRTGPLPQSFPGGNTTFARHFVKYLVPEAVAGSASFEDVHRGRVDVRLLDRRDRPVRIRLGATVVRVQHTRTVNHGEHVAVAYEQAGRVHLVHARAVVLASNGMMNRAVVADLPDDIARAYGEFMHAPALVVNVALNNWRFLHRLGAPCCRWFDDEFGFSCNIRRAMVAGDPLPPMTPDQPIVLTFYMGLYALGRPLAEQLSSGRARLLQTSYADYERLIRRHMTRLFAGAGFDAARDIAGIILNRWGHARLVQPPGFYFGRDGKPSAREVVAKGYGRVAIGHSELNGHQSATGAMAQGHRVAEQVLALLPA